MNPFLLPFRSGKARTVVVSAALLTLADVAIAAGFFNANHSTEATARGNAWVATADSAAAVYYNPAGLVQLDSASVEAGVYMPYLGTEMRSDFPPTSGQTFRAEKELQYVPSIFAALPTKGPWAFGVGMHVPFGLASEWGQDTPWRTITTQAELTQLRFSAVGAYQVTETLSLGGGLCLDYADATLKQGIGVEPGDETKFEGDGTALTWLVSLLWQPHEQHSVGLVYRSAANFNLEGNVSSRSSLPPNFVPNGSANTGFYSPASAAVGYAYKPNDRLTIEGNIEWIDWDGFNTFTLDGAGMPAPQAVPFDFKSTFIYELGLSYKFNDCVTGHLGYDYNQGAAKSTYYNPAVPDIDMQYLNTGLNYQVTENLVLMGAYQFGWGEEDISSSEWPVVDGSYKARHHNFMLSARWDF